MSLIEQKDISIAFYIGSLPITWYGILVTIGLIFSVCFMYFEWTKRGQSKIAFSWLLFVGLVGGFLGSRWLYLILNPSDITNVIDFFTFSSGRSILGALVGGSFSILLFLKFYNLEIDWRMVASIALPHILLGQAIGRWGNFTNQEIYGHVMVNPNFWTPFIKDSMYIDGEYRFPLFFVEFILNFLGWLIIAIAIKKASYFKKGTHGALYFVWYGLTRSSLELLRNDKFIMRIGPIPSSFVLSILMTIFGIFLFFYLQYFYWEKQMYKYNVKPYKKQYKKNVKTLKKQSKENLSINYSFSLLQLTEQFASNSNQMAKKNEKFFKNKIKNDSFILTWTKNDTI